MSMKPLQKLVRPNIWALKPYSSARDEYKEVRRLPSFSMRTRILTMPRTTAIPTLCNWR